MKKIIIKEDFIFLYLNKLFYDINLINSSIKNYIDFFKFKINTNSKYTIIKFEKKDNQYKLEMLVFEFLNYLLSEKKENFNLEDKK